MSYFVTCTHEQRILNGTSSDTSLCHWGYLEKKIFPDVPDLPDLGRLGNFFFSKKKKIFPDLARSGRPRSGDLARSGSIRVFFSSSFFFFFFFFFFHGSGKIFFFFFFFEKKNPLLPKKKKKKRFLGEKKKEKRFENPGKILKKS